MTKDVHGELHHPIDVNRLQMRGRVLLDAALAAHRGDEGEITTRDGVSTMALPTPTTVYVGQTRIPWEIMHPGLVRVVMARSHGKK